MIKIDRVFFCDSIAPGQFGKLNIFGLLPANSIALNEVPYSLVSHVVAWGQTSETDTVLVLKLDLKDKNAKTLSSTVHQQECAAKTVSGQAPFQLFVVWPCTLHIESYGSLVISVLTADNQTLYEARYGLVEGEAPNSAVKGHVPQSAVFSGADNRDSQFVADLIATANKTLKIFDAYVDPAALTMLLAKVHRQTKVVLITGRKSKAAFQASKSVAQQFPFLTVKGTSQLHDRFLVINDSEYFHFGHSLKDVARGKLSRFSKVVNAEELVQLVTRLDSLEKQAVS